MRHLISQPRNNPPHQPPNHSKPNFSLIPPRKTHKHRGRRRRGYDRHRPIPAAATAISSRRGCNRLRPIPAAATAISSRGTVDLRRIARVAVAR